MQELLDDASLPTDADGLRAQILILEERLQNCEQDIKDLMAGEAPAQGLDNAAAIHEAKQIKMMLRYQKDLRQVRLNLLMAN